jgi:hypothetical protein
MGFQVGVEGLDAAEQADGPAREQKDQHGGQSGFRLDSGQLVNYFGEKFAH